jgi:methylmalonyl-CoA mutase N-terminal domain/subunit
LRTQQIIAHESGVCDFIDPLGGSWALEALTDELEARAEAYIRKIDEMGGMLEALSRGYPQREIEDAAYTAQKEIEQKKQIVIGVNEFVTEEAPFDTLRVDPALEEQQVARLKKFRASRDSAAATRALSDLKRAAQGTSENLVPHIVTAVKSKATLGEIANSMREVFGEHGH